MQIWLIRHGESTGNVKHIMQGQQNFPLSSRGEAQARQLGQVMAARRWRPAQIYTSPLKRTLQTAELIQAEFAKPPALSTHPELIEIDVGALQGLTLPEIRQQYPTFDQVNPAGWVKFAPFGGEDATQLWQRVHRWLDVLSGSWNATRQPPIAIVTHGIVVRAALAWALEDRKNFMMDYTLGNCVLVSVNWRHTLRGVRRSLAALHPIETWES